VCVFIRGVYQVMWTAEHRSTVTSRIGLRAAPVAQRGWIGLLLAIALAAFAAPSIAAAPAGTLGIELNKLEQRDRSCLAYLVFRNETGLAFDAVQLDLVLFDRDELILRRLTVDAAPIARDKTSVKIFEIPDMACDQLGRVLLNDLARCEGASGPIDGCLERIDLSSRVAAALFK